MKRAQKFADITYCQALIDRSFNVLSSVAISIFIVIITILLIQLKNLEYINGSIAGLILSQYNSLAMRISSMLTLLVTIEKLLNSIQRLIEYAELETE